MNNKDFIINENLSYEEQLVADSHEKIIADKNPAYFIPWSKRNNYPIWNARNTTYRREVLNFDNECQNLKIKLNKLYKVNKKNKILIKTMVLTFILRYDGNNFLDMERVFNNIKYFRFKDTGEVEVFEDKNVPMSFRIFLAYSYDYYKFHSETNFSRYALFEEIEEDSVIFSLVPYSTVIKNEPSSLEQRLYKKFLNDYVLEEEK